MAGSILKVTKADGTSVWLPDPKRGGLSISIQDLDASTTGRNQKGELFRDRVAVKRKISYSAPPLSKDEVSSLLEAITDQFFSLQYRDPQTGSTKSIMAYTSERV